MSHEQKLILALFGFIAFCWFFVLMESHVKIDHTSYEWSDEDLKTFRNFEDQWHNLCMEHGVSPSRAFAVADRYNEQRTSRLVSPKIVLDRWYLAICREFPGH